MAIGSDDFLQDVIGLGSPDERLGGLIMHGDVFPEWWRHGKMIVRLSGRQRSPGRNKPRFPIRK